MKYYFTEWIPVKRKIIVGDTFSHIGRIYTASELTIKMGYASIPLELCLCSRAFEVGCKYYSLTFNEYYPAEDEHASCFKRPYEYLRVIAPIEHEWVKKLGGGQEFDEDDVKVYYKFTRRTKSNPISSCSTLSPVDYMEFLCPHCDEFT